MIRKVDDSISVAPQISPEDVARIAAAGFTLIVNNRPDDESPDQPAGSAIEAAARAAGLGYVAIPVTHAGFSASQVGAMADALDAATGPVFAFCRSGTRSCNLWALARASRGEAPDPLIEKAAGVGYDLNGIRPLLETLSGKA